MELQQDVEEFGEDEPCYLFYKIKDDHILFTNYDFITKEMPLKDDDILESEKVVETTLKYAYEVIKDQNRLI